MSNTLAEILSLSQDLVRIASITVGSEERLEDVWRAYGLIRAYVQQAGLELISFEQGKYPAVLVGFPGRIQARVMLSGHFDVVAPEPDFRQFEPRIEADYLWGRGAADMKTVVATYLVWMKDILQAGPPYPSVNLLLIGNEENGEFEPMGSGHVLDDLRSRLGYQPDLFIAGERTEESGRDLWGQICVENRGVGRFQVVLRGKRGHSGMSNLENDLTHRLIQTRLRLNDLAQEFLTLDPGAGWYSQIRFPFVRIGTEGVYNITPDRAVLGVELRGIPQDDVAAMFARFQEYCREQHLEIGDLLLEAGVACDPRNPELLVLVDAVRDVSRMEPVIGRKLAGTSARFAPGGNGVVWGQSGIGPHAADERHYIPSILPYYHVLDRFGQKLIQLQKEQAAL